MLSRPVCLTIELSPSKVSLFQRVAPVSYTHLDVYKRQVTLVVEMLVLSGSVTVMVPVKVCPGGQSGSLIVVELGRRILSATPKMAVVVLPATTVPGLQARFGAVSYTHLDVYKRQRQERR